MTNVRSTNRRQKQVKIHLWKKSDGMLASAKADQKQSQIYSLKKGQHSIVLLRLKILTSAGKRDKKYDEGKALL